MVVPRSFIVLLHYPLPSTPFHLNDLTTCRVDLLCRCISSALFLSYGTRRDTQVIFVLPPPSECERRVPSRLVVVNGEDVRHLRPDERNLAGVLRFALYPPEDEDEGDGKWKKATRGVVVEAGTLVDALHRCRITSPNENPQHVFLLCEEGPDFPSCLPSCPPSTAADHGDWVFVLGDKTGFTQQEQETCLTMGAQPVSLGPQSLLTSHCIVLLHGWLDRWILPSSK